MRRIGSRIQALHRKLRPAGLVQRWYDVLVDINEGWEIGWSEKEVQTLAREAAATGRDPGDVLAECLIEAANERS